MNNETQTKIYISKIEKERAIIIWVTHQCQEQLALSQGKAKIQELHLGLSYGGQEPKYLNRYLLPPGIH